MREADETSDRDARPRRRVLRLVARLALAAASFGLVAGAAEIGLRLAGYQPIYRVYSRPSLLWRHDELLGWSHEPGAQDTFVGPRPFPIEFRSPVEINSQGLRGPEPRQLPPDGYRILLLGDSLVAGFEVAYEATFVAVLEELLNQRVDFPVETLNAGVRGYGTDQSYLWFREHGRLLEPDLVVFFHSFNDPENNMTLHRMRRPFGKAAFALDDGSGLELRGHPIPRYPACAALSLDADFEPTRRDGVLSRAVCNVQVRLADHSALFTWVTLRIRRSPTLLRWLYDLAPPGQLSQLPGNFGHAVLAAGEPEARPTPRYALTTALLLELAASVRASGADFLLVVPRNEWQQLDAAALVAAGIAYDHGELQLSAEAGRYIKFRNDRHLNETGHGLFARYLADLLAPLVEAARGTGEL